MASQVPDFETFKKQKASASKTDIPTFEEFKAQKDKTPATPPESALSRFGESFGAASGLRHPIQTVSTLGHQILHPVETAKAYGQENRALFDAAKESYGKGNYLEATRHAMNYLLNAIPGLGSSMEKASEQMGKGDIAGGLGTTVGVGTVFAGPEIAGKGLGVVGKLRQRAGAAFKRQAQFVTKTGAEYTTRPIFEKYVQKAGAAEEKQVAADTAFAQKSSAKQALGDQSKQLGDQLVDLNTKLRHEGNEKYAPVHEATAQDAGVPATGGIEAVRHIKQNILEGSQEKIAQFEQILKMESEAEQVSAGAGHPIDTAAPEAQNILSFLESEGISAQAPNVPFRTLKGWGSEIQAKLFKGPAPGQGDVWRGLKYLNDNWIQPSKRIIAERNGVGPALLEADAFWRSYMDAFYDRESAVAQVGKRTGVTDPEFYADPFRIGKAAKTGIAKLRRLPSQHSAELNQAADLAQSIREGQSAMTEMGTVRRKEIPKPKPPTVEQILKTKEERVASKAAELGGLRRFDLMMSISALTTVARHGMGADWITSGLEGIAAGTGAVLLEKRLAFAIDSPAVRKFLTTFSEKDVAEAARLPEPMRTQLQQNIRAMIKYKLSPKEVPPALKRFVGAAGVGATAQPVKNRKEALELLKK